MHKQIGSLSMHSDPRSITFTTTAIVTL